MGVWDRSNEYCTDLVHAWAGGTRIRVTCVGFTNDPHSLICRKATRLVSPRRASCNTSDDREWGDRAPGRTAQGFVRLEALNALALIGILFAIMSRGTHTSITAVAWKRRMQAGWRGKEQLAAPPPLAALPQRACCKQPHGGACPDPRCARTT